MKHSTAFEYHINYLCQTKYELGLGGLLQLLKDRDIARAALKIEAPELKKNLEKLRVVNFNSSKGPEEVSVESLFKRARLLEDYQSACVDCPANFCQDENGAFGCVGSIRYPIMARAEETIISVAQNIIRKSLESLAADPLRFILEKKIDGRMITALRRDSGQYFELSRPIVAKTGFLFWKLRISSDQLFELLMGWDYIPADGLFLISGFTEELERSLSPSVLQSAYFSDIYRYLKALELAHHLKADVYLSA